MLATEIGLNNAARRLGVPISTAKSWARRGKWQLPKRPGGRPQKTIEATGCMPVADAHAASREELLDAASTAILDMIAKTATRASKKGALDVATVAELNQLATALARARGDQSQVNVAVNSRTVIVTEAKRKELQEKLARWQLDNLDNLDNGFPGRRQEAQQAKAHVAPLPAPQTQSTCNVGAGSANLTPVPASPKPSYEPFQETTGNEYEPEQENWQPILGVRLPDLGL